jgi:virginiamycin B lyase
MTIVGVVTKFPILTANSYPGRMAVGPDGNLWFTETVADKIGRITPTGTVTEFSIPADGTSSLGSSPTSIAAGSDGNLWFTELTRNKMGRISPGGTISECSLSLSDVNVNGIALGPDGNLWYTIASSGKIGRLTP